MSLFTGALALAGAAAAAGGTVAAAKIGSNAANKAGERESAGVREALDFTKGQKAKQEAAYAPFQQLSQQATGRLADIARPAPQFGPPAPYSTQPRATMPMQAAGMPLSAMGQQMPQVAVNPNQAAQMVRMAGPDGSIKMVPLNLVEEATRRGAKRVG